MTVAAPLMTYQAVAPLLTHPATTTPTGGGMDLLGGVFSTVTNVAKAIAGVGEHPATQTIMQSVYQWKELDLRKEAQKAQESLWNQILGAIGGQPQIGQLGTPPIVAPGSVQAVPVPTPANGGDMNWLIPVAIVGALVLLAGRKG